MPPWFEPKNRPPEPDDPPAPLLASHVDYDTEASHGGRPVLWGPGANPLVSLDCGT